MRFTLCVLCADCSVEVLAEVKRIRCIGYKTGFAFHCFGSVHTAVSSYLTTDIRTEKDSRCLCRDCLGWCCLLSAFIHACKSCKLLVLVIVDTKLILHDVVSNLRDYILHMLADSWSVLVPFSVRTQRRLLAGGM